MSSLVNYYAVSVVIFLAIIIYNVAFFATYKDDICKTKIPVEGGAAGGEEAAAEETAAAEEAAEDKAEEEAAEEAADEEEPANEEDAAAEEEAPAEDGEEGAAEEAGPARRRRLVKFQGQDQYVYHVQYPRLVMSSENEESEGAEEVPVLHFKVKEKPEKRKYKVDELFFDSDDEIEMVEVDEIEEEGKGFVDIRQKLKKQVEISYEDFVELQQKRTQLVRKFQEMVSKEDDWEDEIEDDHFDMGRFLQEDSGGEDGGNAKTVNSSLSLVTLPLIIVIVYGAIAFLTLMAMFFINMFSSMSSERFGKLGWCLGCCGIYVRNFAFMVRMLSYLVLLLLGVQACLIFFTPDCKDAKHITLDGIKVGAMYEESITVLLVDLCFWGFSHCLFPLVKKTLDQEAFLYEPFDRDKSIVRYVLCDVLGP